MARKARARRVASAASPLSPARRAGKAPAHVSRSCLARAAEASEQAIQTLLSFPLRKDGYEVVQATDGREALARFGETTFDLVVLDVMLPRLDGLEVCRRMRARSSV